MKKIFSAFALLLCLTSFAANTDTITVYTNDFVPSYVAVLPLDTVRFIWAGGSHLLYAESPQGAFSPFFLNGDEEQFMQKDLVFDAPTTVFVSDSFNLVMLARIDVLQFPPDYCNMKPIDSTLTIDFNDFQGTGFHNDPAAGQLDSDCWSIIGLSDQDTLGYGDENTAGDFARGTSPGDVFSSGIYAFDNGSTGNMLGFQPSVADLTPGSFTLRLLNDNGSSFTKLDIEYDVWVRNDQDKSSFLNFAYSLNDDNYTEVPQLDFSSPFDADASPDWVLEHKSTSINVFVPNDGLLFLRWYMGEVAGGSGSNRDEFGIDNIEITASIFFPPLEASFEVRDVCDGDTVQFENTSIGGVPPDYTYEWNFGDGSPTVNSVNPRHFFMEPDTYMVSLTTYDTDSTNMDDTTIAVAVFANPMADFTATQTGGAGGFEFDFLAEQLPGYGFSFAWDFDDGSPENTDNMVTHIFPGEDIYDVCLAVTEFHTDTSLPILVDTTFCTVIECEQLNLIFTSQEEVGQPKELRVFPNPNATGLLTVKGLEGVLFDEGRIQIYDMVGRAVVHESISGDQWNGTYVIDVSGLSPGKYWFSMTTDQFAVDEKLILY